MVEVTAQTAADHVRLAEQRLREVVAKQLARTHGSTWENEVSQKVRRRIEAIKAQEIFARPHARQPDHILGYAGFDHLVDVVEHHWQCCAQSLNLWPDLDLAKYELGRLQAVRNPAMHGRDLFPHEYIEGEGAARRLRFQVEDLWRREANMTGEFWLYLEQIEDSLGNRSTEAGSFITVTGARVLYVGDLVHIKVRAFDPHGRVLRYRLAIRGGNESNTKSDWGDSPEFDWIAAEVTRKVSVDIEVRAEGEPHADPRQDWFDAFATFVYEVRPRPLI